MLRELRRFPTIDSSGDSYELVEVALFMVHNGRENMDGVPVIFTSSGRMVEKTDRCDEYFVPSLRLTLRGGVPDSGAEGLVADTTTPSFGMR